MKVRFSHLSLSERRKIERWRQMKLSPDEMARKRSRPCPGMPADRSPLTADPNSLTGRIYRPRWVRRRGSARRNHPGRKGPWRMPTSVSDDGSAATPIQTASRRKNSVSSAQASMRHRASALASGRLRRCSRPTCSDAGTDARNSPGNRSRIWASASKPELRRAKFTRPTSVASGPAVRGAAVRARDEWTPRHNSCGPRPLLRPERRPRQEQP